MATPPPPFPVLVTGFEPFGGDVANPSADIAQALHGQKISRHPIFGLTLPCVFATSHHVLGKAMRTFRPGLIVGLGLASGRQAITPERIAINLDDARIPDNAGAQPLDRRVVRLGPAAYWSTLPVKNIVTALRDAGFPADVSHSAGTFVCNHAFYHLMHALRNSTKIRGGFIHVPAAAPRNPGSFSMPLPEQIAAIRLAVEVALLQPRDTNIRGGEIS